MESPDAIQSRLETARKRLEVCRQHIIALEAKLERLNSLQKEAKISRTTLKRAPVVSIREWVAVGSFFSNQKEVMVSVVKALKGLREETKTLEDTIPVLIQELLVQQKAHRIINLSDHQRYEK